MSPEELFRLTPLRTTRELHELHHTAVPELGIYSESDLYPDRLSRPNLLVQINTYAEYIQDHRRYWRTCGVLFDKNPMMILVNAGREGDDYYERYILDAVLYKQMIIYVKSLMLPPEHAYKPIDVIDPKTDIPELTDYYNKSFHVVDNKLKYSG